jgi:hypothetical protein
VGRINEQELVPAYEVLRDKALLHLKNDPQARYFLMADWQSAPGFVLILLATRQEEIMALLVEEGQAVSTIAELRKLAETHA